MKKLNLGKELDKNAQKKVVGGAFIVCQENCPPYDVNYYYNMPSCGMAEAYCSGTHQTFVYCE